MPQTQPHSFAFGFVSVRSKLVREYANSVADAYLNDLACGRISPEPESNKALLNSFMDYVQKWAEHRSVLLPDIGTHT
jgi:hypothetical protein